MAIILDADVIIQGEKGTFDLRGWRTGYYDLIVAATARHRGSHLATFNRRHFEHIGGLVLAPL